MIWVITKWRGSDNETFVDCVKATHKKARDHVDAKNREIGSNGEREWFYQMWEREIE